MNMVSSSDNDACSPKLNSSDVFFEFGSSSVLRSNKNDASDDVEEAALDDDWDSVNQNFEQDPELMTKQINHLGETPLIIAVGTNLSHRFVQNLVEHIVTVGDADELWVTSYGGSNALHNVAKVGNTIDAKLLVVQNLDMTRDQNHDGYTPLALVVFHGNQETLDYLLTVTMDLVPEEKGSSLYTVV
ncbi:hypothetical protein L6452_19316 [Arctium lappa]|uniref:Uncharacterized protein n=1 Tax=Arctium lappa TaxID=4217 RepID=A0ACB9B8C2_ARCLA|nr:hypothetical protein L6452_19316 [Arctium lappa]